MGSKIIETETIAVPPDEWVTAEQLQGICCESVPVPPCRKKVEDWKGYDAGEVLDSLGIELDAEGCDVNGYKVEVLLVKPPTGICGQKETIYELKQKDCCEDVDPLEIDSSASVEVVDQNSYGVVYVSGGKSPYTWAISGVDFFLSNGAKEMVTEDPWVRLVTGPDACGSANVAVSDGCTSADYYVRSTVGEWVLVRSSINDPCFISTSSVNTGCGNLGVFTFISGKYKVEEDHYRQSWVVNDQADAEEWCNSRCPTAGIPCIDPFYTAEVVFCDYCAFCVLINSAGGTERKSASISLSYKYQYEWKC